MTIWRNALIGFGAAALVVAVVVVVAFVLVRPAGAAEDDEGGRFVPAARGVERWREAVAEYPWPVDTALAVMRCESNGDPYAVNPRSGAAGLFQLYGWGPTIRRLFGAGEFDPWANIAMAFVLWEDSGGRFGWHWAASRACWAG